MKRALAIAVALVLAGVLAWAVTRADGGGPLAVCASFERRLQAGEIDSARRIRDAAHDLPPHLVAYLDALLALAAGKDADAAKTIEGAWESGGAARDEWRVASLVFTTRVNAGHKDDAWAVVDGYLAAHADDPRALVAAAQYWIEVRADDPDPDRAVAYLDRAARAPADTVPRDDPTAVRPALTERLRGRAEQIRGMTGSAIAAAEGRVAAEPQSAAAHAQLGEAFRAAHRLEAARQAFREALKLEPPNILYGKQLTLLLLETADTGPEVGPLADRLAAQAPDDPEVQILCARALVRTDRIDEAIQVYERLRKPPLSSKLTKGQQAEVCRNLAIALYDWRQGGQEGEFLRDAYLLLVEYRALGGDIDLRLRHTWETLQALYGSQGGGPK